MKTIATRAVSVLLLAGLIVAGLGVYIQRYVEHGARWAIAYSRLNSQSGGELLDRNGQVLAAFDAKTNRYAADSHTRTANYHVTGDFYGRTGTGLLSGFWSDMQGFSLLTGTTHAQSGTLNLTVDADLNRVAYDAFYGRRGAALLVNYRTGELLAMTSSPAVDPADPEAIPGDGAFINRCLSSSFVPGSTFKLITAAAAIETLPNIFERTFYCEKEGSIAGVPIICVAAHYTENFEQALANSCNIAFAQIAVSVGQDTLVRYVKDYGFLDPHRLNGIPTAAGNFPTEFVGDPELGWAGVGQSTDLVCPFSMLRFVAAVGNGGVLVEPTLLLGDNPGRERLMNPDTAEILGGMMNYNVVAHYGQENFPGLKLCAKTGTGELGDGSSNGWFVGYLNDERHPYAFVVMVEDAQFGITDAAPIATALLTAAVQKYH